MPDELQRARQRLEASQRAVARLDARLAREVAQAYQDARRNLLADLTDAFIRLGDEPTPAQIRSLLTQAGLVDSIDQRLAALEQQFSLTVQTGITDVTGASLDAVQAEIAHLAGQLGVNMLLPFALDPLLELTVGPALAQVPGLTGALRAALTGQLRVGLAQGWRMQELIRALYGVEGSVWHRGLISARLMVHRAVTEAENTARLAYLEQAGQQIPGLQKQAIAVIDSSTSRTCLGLHGQIQPLDRVFQVDGGFGDRMGPPFHWGPCRTSVAGYHPIFEQTSNLTTAQMEAAAAAELDNR